MNFPRRIVCEETTETVYLLGEQDRIADVSACISAKFDKILAREPDLVRI